MIANYSPIALYNFPCYLVVRRAGTLKNKVVWVTGASSGIGEGLAHKLAKIGCKLILSGRQATKLDEVKQACVTFGLEDNDVLVLPFDMCDIATHQTQFDRALQHFQNIDILVQNAGRSQRALFHEIDLDVDRSMFVRNQKQSSHS